MSHVPTPPQEQNHSFTLTVEEQDQGARIDKYLALHCTSLSRSRIQQLITTGHIQKNGCIVEDASLRVKAGERIGVNIPPAIPTEMQPAEHIPLNILYEDEQLLVINKQAGLTVHPGAGNYQDTLANALLAYCGESLSGIGGVARPGIVHRLDKDTSGVMLVAKTDLAHQSLSEQIAARTAKREYKAVIWGVMQPTKGKIEGNIARSNRDRTKMEVVREGGKTAITHYETEEILQAGALSFITCRLETGRTHQIRVHFSNLGHALLGDPTYGSQRKRRIKLPDEVQEVIEGFTRQALHAASIQFTHPLTHEIMRYEAPLPEDMDFLINKLKSM